jgi:hypothetical protein
MTTTTAPAPPPTPAANGYHNLRLVLDLLRTATGDGAAYLQGIVQGQVHALQHFNPTTGGPSAEARRIVQAAAILLPICPQHQRDAAQGVLMAAAEAALETLERCSYGNAMVRAAIYGPQA